MKDNWNWKLQSYYTEGSVNKLHIFLDHLVLQESTIDMLTMVSTSVPQVTLLLMKLTLFRSVTDHEVFIFLII